MKIQLSSFNYIKTTKFMNIDCRLLPRISQLYMQKHSFQIHKKKLQAIKKSYNSHSNSQKNLVLPQELPNQQTQLYHVKNKIVAEDTPSNKLVNVQTNNKSQNSYQMNVIKQHLINSKRQLLNDWKRRISPLQKRKISEQIKQNQRLNYKIQKSVSFISNRKQMLDHYQNTSNIKNRLCKFSIKSESSHANFKNAVVLNNLNKSNKLRYEQLKPKIPLHIYNSPLRLSENTNISKFQSQSPKKMLRSRQLNSGRKTQQFDVKNNSVHSYKSSISNILPLTSQLKLKKNIRVKTQQRSRKDQYQAKYKHTKVRQEGNKILQNYKGVVQKKLTNVKVTQPFKNKFLRQQILKKKIMNSYYYNPKINRQVKNNAKQLLKDAKMMSIRQNRGNIVQIGKLRRQNYTQLKHNRIKTQQSPSNRIDIKQFKDSLQKYTTQQKVEVVLINKQQVKINVKAVLQLIYL